MNSSSAVGIIFSTPWYCTGIWRSILLGILNEVTNLLRKMQENTKHDDLVAASNITRLAACTTVTFNINFIIVCGSDDVCLKPFYIAVTRGGCIN